MCPYNPAIGAARRRRGCLTGCITQVVSALILGVVLVFALYGLLAPWGYYLGGNSFHLEPGWTGWGRMHSDNLGDFALYVTMTPSFRGSRMFPHSNLTGIGYLCTPRGETFRMHISADMRPNLGLNTNGEKINLAMDYWPALTGRFISDRRPSIGFRGQWQNPNIILDDHGSLSTAFQSNGTVYRGHDPNSLPPKEIVPLILQPGTYNDFKSACTTLTPQR